MLIPLGVLLALAAILMGFALSVKTLALIPLALSVVLLVSARAGWQRAALFAGIAVAVGSPFYLKSWVVTGNPVYPFGYRLFGGRGKDLLHGGRGLDRCWGRRGANSFRGCQRIFD